MTRCYVMTYFIELIYKLGEIELQFFENKYLGGETQHFKKKIATVELLRLCSRTFSCVAQLSFRFFPFRQPSGVFRSHTSKLICRDLPFCKLHSFYHDSDKTQIRACALLHSIDIYLTCSSRYAEQLSHFKFTLISSIKRPTLIERCWVFLLSD